MLSAISRRSLTLPLLMATPLRRARYGHAATPLIDAFMISAAFERATDYYFAIAAAAACMMLLDC